jgi:hypothetical protein
MKTIRETFWTTEARRPSVWFVEKIDEPKPAAKPIRLNKPAVKPVALESESKTDSRHRQQRLAA